MDDKNAILSQSHVLDFSGLAGFTLIETRGEKSSP